MKFNIDLQIKKSYHNYRTKLNQLKIEWNYAPNQNNLKLKKA